MRKSWVEVSRKIKKRDRTDRHGCCNDGSGMRVCEGSEGSVNTDIRV